MIEDKVTQGHCMMQKKALFFFIYLLLTGCASPPPANVHDICSVFNQHPRWYHEAKSTQKQWGVSIATQMAIIHQESKFDSQAKPKRRRLLGFIPWKRPSSAYGYTQALTQTWQAYQRERGGFFSRRDNFGDGVDFIGWYANLAHRKASISRDDTYALYLAYHEGIGGYQRKTYLKKSWLQPVARKVAKRAQIYQAQLERCGLVKRDK